MTPNWRVYGDYVSEGYGAHTLAFTDDQGREWFWSYRTLVALRLPTGFLAVRKNVWGPTTGRHLNWIDGGGREARNDRLSAEDFQFVVEQQTRLDDVRQNEMEVAA